MRTEVYNLTASTITHPGRKMSQKDRILAALRMGPVCGSQMSDWCIARYGARLHELRAEGHEITKRPCRMHEHESNMFVYELAEPDQMSLGLDEVLDDLGVDDPDVREAAQKRLADVRSFDDGLIDDPPVDAALGDTK